MKKVFEIVKDSSLFKGIEYHDFVNMYKCIEARTRSYEKDAIVLLAGEPVNYVGLILSGRLRIIKDDLSGSSTIINELTKTELFGETFACAEVDHSSVTVQAFEKSEVLLINYKRIISNCSSVCGFHLKLIENMLRLIAEKNLILNRKVEILSKRTTRDKLLMFFNTHRGAASKFTIPYNRDELARYLCVDRSAMSNELCKMRDEGIIQFKKNEFEIM